MREYWSYCIWNRAITNAYLHGKCITLYYVHSKKHVKIYISINICKNYMYVYKYTKGPQSTETRETDRKSHTEM